MVTRERPLLDIGYKYTSHKVLSFFFYSGGEEHYVSYSLFIEVS